MRIAYLTVDDVNEDLALRMAKDCGVTLYPLTFRDPPPDGQFDAVLYDWDHFPPREQREIAARLLDDSPSCPAGVHGYNLPERQMEALRRKAVVIFHTLQPEVFLLLCLAAVRPRADSRSGQELRDRERTEERWADSRTEI